MGKYAIRASANSENTVLSGILLFVDIFCSIK